MVSKVLTVAPSSSMRTTSASWVRPPAEKETHSPSFKKRDKPATRAYAGVTSLIEPEMRNLSQFVLRLFHATCETGECVLGHAEPPRILIASFSEDSEPSIAEVTFSKVLESKINFSISIRGLTLAPST